MNLQTPTQTNFQEKKMLENYKRARKLKILKIIGLVKGVLQLINLYALLKYSQSTIIGELRISIRFDTETKLILLRVPQFIPYFVGVIFEQREMIFPSYLTSMFAMTANIFTLIFLLIFDSYWKDSDIYMVPPIVLDFLINLISLVTDTMLLMAITRKIKTMRKFFVTTYKMQIITSEEVERQKKRRQEEDY